MGLISSKVSFWLYYILSIVVYMHSQISSTEAVDIGVCYGMNGDNLPPPPDVVQLYKRYGITKLRLFDPNPQALEALRGSQIAVSLGTRNEDITNISSSQAAADAWFDTNVAPYLNDVIFSYISVGNEAIPGPSASSIAAAMQNLQNTLDARNLPGIKVSTVVSSAALGSSYPPSSGAFAAEARDGLVAILQFLSAHGSPLMINVYPYFPYASDPVNIQLSYATFTSAVAVVQDGPLSYFNLFDAIVDAWYSAMEREGFGTVGVVVSESGWPSAGNGDLTTPDIAGTYNRNFIQHVTTSGTPKRPNDHIESYIFAMFDEDLKQPPGTENHFGLFSPGGIPNYPVFN